MIKFFRKIRYNLMSENKTGKYLKYAIGEIVLVVIGILIALSINNWNEDRKLKREELNLLADIKTNLEVTLDEFNSDLLNNNNKDIYFYTKIEKYIEDDLPYHEELDSAFGCLTFWNSPYITSTTYKSLQTKGIDIIKNETLRNNIVKMHEVVFVELTDDYHRSEWNISQKVVMPFFSKHIRR